MFLYTYFIVMKKISELLNDYTFETNAILRKLISTHRALAELKWITQTIPNMFMLVSTLSLQEAKESSAIENIITTQDELYQSNNIKKQFVSLSAKEVYSYWDALIEGMKIVTKNKSITIHDIIKIQKIIEKNDAGIRRLPWTLLKNEQTGKIVYEPPQSYQEILDLMYDFENFINNNKIFLDPLIKMAIVHHQFESIHPFYDANGRVGRIINVLYLVKEWLLDSPILYLSRSINKNKVEYYRLLQTVRDQWSREERILWILTRVEETAIHTSKTIQKIKELMLIQKHLIRSKLPKIYSQELLNNIFKHPYTKIEFLKNDLLCSRITATKYLDQLVKINVLEKIKSWRDSYYLNSNLIDLLQNISL